MVKMNKDKIVTESKNLRSLTPNRAEHIKIEIGDSKQADFMPRVKLMAWDNEANLSIGLITDHKADRVSTKSQLVEWSNPDYDAKIYPLDHLEDGGLEFEFTLREKPENNRIDLSIRTKGLDFFYQAPLTNEEKLEGLRRRKNVEGSYAVYYRGEPGDYSSLGGKNYKTGKAFHIYRPHAIDSDGNTAWGDLNIDEEKELLTIILPTNFLDNASYPIWVDPTVGYSGVGATDLYLNGTSSKEWFVAQVPSSGKINKLSAYYQANMGVKVSGALYTSPVTEAQVKSNTSNKFWLSKTFNRLDYTPFTASSNSTVGWIDTPNFVNEYNLAAGSNYVFWFRAITTSSKDYTTSIAVDTVSYYNSETMFDNSDVEIPSDANPPPLVTTTRGNWGTVQGKFSIYATYGEGGGSDPEPEPTTSSAGLLGGWF